MSDFLRNSITHAGIQDNLLQTYRALSLSLQSLLLAVGIFLLSRLVEAGSIEIIRFYLVPIYIVCAAAIYISIKFMDVVLHRGKDVTYWHKQIIALEQKEDQSNRYFTKFKFSQKNSRSGDEYLVNLTEPREEPLSDDEIENLIGKGLGHTRKVLDRYIPFSILSAWFVLVAVSTWIYWIEVNK